MGGVKWTGDGTKLDGVIGKVILPAVASPVIAGVVAAVGTWLIFRVVANVAEQFTNQGFRWGQIGSASLVSLAHGTNDAQKTMGVITLALIAAGQWTDTTAIPTWVKFSCAIAIAAGTYAGGWRVIRTLGKGLVEIAPPQGMAAESASAAVILASSHLGFALSTTHVATGSILGSGVGRPGATVRWGVAGRMVTAWLITLPAAGARRRRDVVHRPPARRRRSAPIVVVLILVALSGYMWMRSRRQPVNAGNVNDEWDDAARRPRNWSVSDEQPRPGRRRRLEGARRQPRSWAPACRSLFALGVRARAHAAGGGADGQPTRTAPDR